MFSITSLWSDGTRSTVTSGSYGPIEHEVAMLAGRVVRSLAEWQHEVPIPLMWTVTDDTRPDWTWTQTAANIGYRDGLADGLNVPATPCPRHHLPELSPLEVTL